MKVMLDKRPELRHARIDEEHFFLDELLKANWAYTREIIALQEKGYLTNAFRIRNNLFNWKNWHDIPEGMGVCIDLSLIPVMPLYRFLFQQDMIGENVFHYHFHMGIGMVVTVPEQNWREAMKIIGQFSECWRIGQVESDDKHKDEKVWMKGQILW